MIGTDDQAAAAAWLLADICDTFPPHVRRAAGEGRDVRAEVRAHVDRSLGDALAQRVARHAAGAHVVKRSYAAKERTGVPSALAYEICDMLGDLAMVAQFWLPGLTAEVGPIARHDIAPTGHRYRTGVTFTLRHPWFLGEDVTRCVLDEPAEDPPRDKTIEDDVRRGVNLGCGDD